MPDVSWAAGWVERVQVLSWLDAVNWRERWCPPNDDTGDLARKHFQGILPADLIRIWQDRFAQEVGTNIWVPANRAASVLQVVSLWRAVAGDVDTGDVLHLD